VIKEKSLKLPVKVARVTKSASSFDGIGVEIIGPKQNYLKLVKSLRTLLPSKKGRSKTK
jgi:hypothetical protein